MEAEIQGMLREQSAVLFWLKYKGFERKSWALEWRTERGTPGGVGSYTGVPCVPAASSLAAPPGATLDGSGEQPWLEGAVSRWREATSPSPRIETESTHHKTDKPDDSLPSAKLVCCFHQET